MFLSLIEKKKHIILYFFKLCLIISRVFFRESLLSKRCYPISEKSANIFQGDIILHELLKQQAIFKI
jgi:hypothetical protein